MQGAIFELLMAEKNLVEEAADARFFALCISHRAVERQGSLAMALGLTIPQLHDLLLRYFPNIAVACAAASCTKVHLHRAAGGNFLCQCLGKDQPELSRSAEVQDLGSLLLDHRNGDDPATEWLAATIASGCMGSDHLWQDLGLTHRDDLSDILRRHFSRLYAANSENMKWKKFFYKQLCDRAEVRICQAPSCSVCNDYTQCFGPETGTGWQLLGNQR